MKYLSFDCANKSLACCVLEVCNTLIKTKIEYIKVVNVWDDNPVKRYSLLNKYLSNLDEIIKTDINTSSGKIDRLLIEYQMVANDKSRCVSQQIMYHYVNQFNQNKDDLFSENVSYDDFVIIGPSIKNKVFLSDPLRHQNFLAKYSSRYTANKNHCKSNLLEYLKQTDQIHLLKSIPKKNWDDVGDAFCQVLGYHYFRDNKKK
jgi:hypothetical protein